MRQFVTTAETWIQHFTPELNRQSHEKLQSDKSRQSYQSRKILSCSRKVLSSIFKISRGIIIDYLGKENNNNSRILCRIIVSLENKSEDNLSYGEEKIAVSPRERIDSNIHKRGGQIEGIEVKIVPLSLCHTEISHSQF